VKVELFKKVLGEVKSKLGEVSEYNQALTLVKIWQATKEMEDLEKSWEIAQQKSYFEIQVEIVKSLALENPEEALKKAVTINEKSWREKAYIEIVKKLSRDKERNSGIISQTISLIENKYHKALALLEIGKINEVLEIAKDVLPELKVKLLILVAKKTRNEKYLIFALKNIKYVKFGNKDCFRKEIAKVFVELGNYRMAKEIADQIGFLDFQIEVLCEIGARDYESFRFVLEKINQIESLFTKSEALKYFARALAKSGRFERALEITEIIGELGLNLDKDIALEEINQIMVQRNLILRAKHIIKQIQNPSLRIKALVELAKFSNEEDDIINAYNEIEKVENLSSKLNLLVELLKVLSDLGRRP
jgi:hypothetical protein